MNIDGEPGAYRKVHAGFGEGHPETPALAGWSAPDAHSPMAWHYLLTSTSSPALDDRFMAEPGSVRLQRAEPDLPVSKSLS